MDNKIPEYSIVIPVYKSGAWLEELVSRTAKAMALYGPFEILLVNDRSPDNETWPAIERLAKEYAVIRGFDMLYNVGQFKATLCGLEQARGRFIITMDDDLQHPPEELPKLVEAMKKNPTMDCVMGQYVRKQHNAVRNLGSRLAHAILDRLYNKPQGVVTTSFRIMTAEFCRSLVLYRAAAPQLGPLIVSLTKKVMNVPVEHCPRKQGQSGYSFFRCIQEIIQSVTNASILPLRLFSLVGFITAFLAFLLTAWFLLRWSFGGIKVAGFTSLILAVSFFSGMILAGIGVLGEYIGRIIQELTGMPRYHLRAQTENSGEE